MGKKPKLSVVERLDVATARGWRIDEMLKDAADDMEQFGAVKAIVVYANAEGHLTYRAAGVNNGHETLGMLVHAQEIALSGGRS